MDCIEKYFDINKNQQQQFEKFHKIFLSWNEKINLVSRKDIEHLCIRHFLHSLAIAKTVNLSGLKIIDVGTGGGLPGIPLAIMFPDAHFTLIDSIGKKITAVNDMINRIGLKNAKALKIRSNELKGKYDFVVARAVTNFPKFLTSVKHLLQKGKKTNIHNGIIYLKGGDFFDEIDAYADRIKISYISSFFDEEFFETKKIIHYKI